MLFTVIDPNSSNNCWLKQNIANKSYGQAYETYVKNEIFYLIKVYKS